MADGLWRSVGGVLAHRDFALLWLGRTLSLLGDYTFRIAFVAYLITETHSAGYVAVATAALLVPPIIFYLIGGTASDRAKSKRRVLIAADVLRFAATAGIAVAAAVTDGTPWLVVALALIIGVGSGFFEPTAFAFIPDVVPREKLLAANSAMSVSQQIGLIIGPALGGGLAFGGGVELAFAFDAVTFLISIVLLAFMRNHGRPAPAEQEEPGKGKLRKEIVEGARYVFGTPWLLLCFGIGALANAVFTGSLDVSIPLMLAPDGVSDAGGLGLFFTLEGVGALLGAILMARLTIRTASFPLFGMLAIMGGSLALAGLFERGWLVYATALSYGVGLHFFNSLYHTLVQVKVPERLLGRVGSLGFVAFDVMMPVGVLAMWPLIALLSERGSLIACGIAVVLMSVAAGLARSVRQLTLDEDTIKPTTVQ
nr:MFS transporter [Kibdelosporangium sp. MJ126-NF4]CEL18025.1 transporter, putative [Kibdelosporangium sp. MJ126-NF4]CTQ90747.1 transporter, putative [Kibdelosporangium sp. MJ126-NF4]